MSTRPDPGPPFRDGAEWVVRPAEHWVVLDHQEPCVQKVGYWMRCGRLTRSAVVTGKNKTPLAWCARHRDDRWIENGMVVEWTLRDLPGEGNDA